jgi:16S rRNA (guanine527-N7)-methyltransferase
MNSFDLETLLANGAGDLLGRPLSDSEKKRLLDYLALLERWNKAYNLTAVRDPLEMVPRHVLDSLSILPWVPPGRLLDAGTGAGLPGVPLAILKPDLDVTLLDSAGKKVRFLRQVKRELRLDNIEPLQARLEAHRAEAPYSAIVSRAFSSLADFALSARHLLTPEVVLLAMKGRDRGSERLALPDWIQVDAVEELFVPGLQEQRHLVIMSLTQ